MRGVHTHFRWGRAYDIKMEHSKSDMITCGLNQLVFPYFPFLSRFLRLQVPGGFARHLWVPPRRLRGHRLRRLYDRSQWPRFRALYRIFFIPQGYKDVSARRKKCSIALSFGSSGGSRHAVVARDVLTKTSPRADKDPPSLELWLILAHCPQGLVVTPVNKSRTDCLRPTKRKREFRFALPPMILG